MGINVTSLRSFVAVAQYGGFTAAAKQCGISQPAITRQVRELEERYGVKLFDRSTRRVRLTDMGEQLYDVASRAFSELVRADQLLTSATQPNVTIFSVRNHMLTRLIELVGTRRVATGLKVRLMPSGDVYDGLISGACDIGFLTMPERGSALDSVEIGRFPVLAYVSDAHPWKARGVISLRDLADQPILIGRPQAQTRRTFDREMMRLGLEPNIVEEVDDYDVLIAMSEAGRGVGIIGSTGGMDRREIEALHFSESGMSQPLHIAAPKPDRRSSLVSALFATFQFERKAI